MSILRDMATGSIGAAVALLIVLPNVSAPDTPSASYAAVNASKCERNPGYPETAAAQDPSSERDRLYSGLVCAGYQTGRLDAALVATRGDGR